MSKKPPEAEVQGQKSRKGASAAHKALITRNLRLAYGEIAGEGVPDRFLDLLGQLDSAEEKS